MPGIDYPNLQVAWDVIFLFYESHLAAQCSQCAGLYHKVKRLARPRLFFCRLIFRSYLSGGIYIAVFCHDRMCVERGRAGSSEKGGGLFGAGVVD